MNADEARLKLRELLGQVNPSELPKLLDWMKNSDELDQLLLDNNKVILQSIAEDLRARLPVDAMLPSETAAQHKMQQRQRPTVHVDSFLYSEDQVDALCEEGAMSRNYCLSCGSFRTAPLDFISHSFSVSELQFLFQNVLPDLSGRTVVDVGSRLGAVLYGGYVYSSASRLIGLELSEDFVRLQNDTLHKYGLSDRVQSLEVHHAGLQEERSPAGYCSQFARESGCSAGATTTRLGGGASCRLQRLPGPRCRP
ncbi:uncharacterized protein LOC102226181 isoform X2 [Xiphophorus maculatus]|uniref:uncharacterized protein LOC102226181 isoform X2 n=1 Tax=Xiphophorus maculatus TaxID=8083 RepID=UPI000C6E1581|nr:uncharacterized protein LOC102226181 isoform X2 [Xiphophorus maculatus]